MSTKEQVVIPSKASVIESAVTLLDNSVEVFKLQGNCTGHDLFQVVIRKLGLLEFQYFDLAFLDMEENHCWLDHGKGLAKLARNLNRASLEFVFAVKYYIPHPHLLANDHARYLFAAQLKRDFFRGLLHSNRNTSLLLAAFIVQSELGDYNESECRSYAYLRKHHLLRTAPDSYLMRVMELHQSLIGLSKAEADYRLLDAARKVELYGVRLHPVKDNTDEDFNLAVTYIGIVVFRNFSRVNGFGWAKIRKLSFKRRKFLIKLHTDEQDLGRDLVEFNFFTQTGCKIFWKKCIEQHAFFRSNTPFHSTVETRRNVGLLNSLRATSFPSLKRLCRSLSYESGAVNGSTNLSLPARPRAESASSSTQTSQMSTPLRRLPRIRYRSSSLKHSKAAVRQSLNGAEDLQNCLSESLKRDSLANKSPYANSYNTLPSRPPGVTRLLSQYNGASDDHFQLLRLSFTSLIPQSTSDTGQNTPTLGRLRTRELTRVDRASSTPSIGRTEHAKRKPNAHCLVPRHFERFVVSSLPRSKASSLSNERDKSWRDEPFPERPCLSKMENSPANNGLATQRETSNGKQMFLQENLSPENPASSSCSLCSSESPTPVSLRSTTVRNLSSPWNRYSSGPVSTDHSSDEDASSACPSLPNAWKPSPLHAFLSISSPHLVLRMDSTEQSEIGSSRHVSPRTELHTPDSIDGQLIGVSTASFKSTTMEHSPGSMYNAAFEKSASFTGTTSEEQKLCSVGQDNHIHRTNSTDILEGLVDTSPSTRMFKSQSPADPAELEYAERLVSSVIADGLQQIIAERDLAQPALVQSSSQFQSFDYNQTLDEDISSSVFQLSSTATGIDAEVPESLADALSLGAISMMTGMFSSSSEQEEHSATGTPIVREKYAASSIKSCISLKQLGRGYWGPAETSSDDESNQSFKVISVRKAKLSRARSESAVVRASKEIVPVPNAHRNKKSRANRKSLRRSRAQPTTVRPHAKDRPVWTPQHPIIDEFTIQVMKSVLQSEVQYNRDLRFLTETTLNMAEATNCVTYINWMRHNVLPLLNPLINRHSQLERVMMASVTEMEQLGNPLVNSQEGSSIENLDPTHRMATLSDENLVGNKIPSSEPTSSSDVSRPGSPKSVTTSQCKLDRSTPSVSGANNTKTKPPVYLGTILILYLDLIQLYNTWLNHCSKLLAELWLLGYADFLHTPKIPSLTRVHILESSEPEHTSSRNSSLKLNKEPTSACNSSPVVDLPNSQPLVRELWYEIESCRACTLPLLTYLLQPGRHVRKYCVQLGALLSHYPADHPDSTACKAAFTEFVQAARTSYPVYQQTEQLALVLQMSRWILPMDSFLGISKSFALSDDRPYATKNTTKDTETFLGFGELSDVLTQVPPLHQFGWLRKYSKRGFQPRMVFLIGDRLLYASRIHGISQISLKLHAIIPLHNVVVEKEAEEHVETELPNKGNASPKSGSEACDQTFSSNSPNTRFSVTVTYRDQSSLGNAQLATVNHRLYDEESIHSKRRIRKHRRKILFSAPNESIRNSWVEKLQSVIESYALTSPDLAFSPVAADASQGVIRLPDPSSSDILRLQLTLQSGENDRTGSSWSIDWKHTRLTAQGVLRNNLLSVCWRRHLTMSHTQLLNNNDCEMHGILFRKFQRGSGYQKLWTVLSEFCMTFYKNPEDPLPQTTLTLPGYSISCVDCSDEENARETKTKRVMSSSHILLKRGSKEHSFHAEANQALMSWFQALQTNLACIQPSVPCGANERSDEPQSCSLIPRKGSSELVFSCTSPCRIRLAGSSVLKT